MVFEAVVASVLGRSIAGGDDINTAKDCDKRETLVNLYYFLKSKNCRSVAPSQKT